MTVTPSLVTPMTGTKTQAQASVLPGAPIQTQYASITLGAPNVTQVMGAESLDDPDTMASLKLLEARLKTV